MYTICTPVVLQQVTKYCRACHQSTKLGFSYQQMKLIAVCVLAGVALLAAGEEEKGKVGYILFDL